MPEARMGRRDFVRAAGVGVAAAAAGGTSAQNPPARAPIVQGEDESLAAVVRKHTGHDATSVEELLWPEIYGGTSARWFSVRCDEREYIVNVPTAPRVWPLPTLGLDVEYHAVIGRYVLDALMERGLAAPLVHAVDRDCDIMPVPLAVSTRIPGRPWEHYEQLRRRGADVPLPADGSAVGSYVRGLHGIAAREGFGPLTDDGMGLMDSWGDLLWTLHHGWAEAGQARGTLTEDDSTLVTEVNDRWAGECEISEGRVLWMSDIMFGIMVDAQKRRVTGVPHAMEAWSGAPDYELEWFAYYAEDTDTLITPSQEFAEGYGRPYDEKSDKRSFYRMSCYLCKLSWLPPDSERAKRHRERLIEIARRLA